MMALSILPTIKASECGHLDLKMDPWIEALQLPHKPLDGLSGVIA